MPATGQPVSADEETHCHLQLNCNKEGPSWHLGPGEERCDVAMETTTAAGQPLPGIVVLTGPLGAGKTTLLQHWLAEIPRGEAAVIVNEFAEVGVDGELLHEHVEAVVELTGGCICCSTQADLVRALVTLSERVPPPRRVFVETSGAASPGAVLRSVARGPVSRRMRLDGVVTVVDPTRIEHVATALLFHEQVALADVIVFSRGDIGATEVFDRAEETLRARNPAAVYARAARGVVLQDVPGGLDGLLARRADVLEAPWVILGAPGAIHDNTLGAVSLALEGTLDGERFSSWIEAVVALSGPRLVRLKGIVAIAGVPVRIVLHGVGGATEVSFGRPWSDTPPRSRVVFIGAGLDADTLREGFARCIAEAPANSDVSAPDRPR